MAEKLINITAPQYRCTFGACPAVYKFYGDESYGIIGKVVNDPDLADRIGEGEAAVEIPADLLLASLGVAELVEALKKAILKMDEVGFLDCGSSEARALREARKKFQGGSA